ncbi:MAG TPA: 3-oxoacid CoA-transferase subunit B [Candidatus Baltobacteraceae bacterium]|nr:3-oxoacid CoA-transferase subunit B [Candidatus Baltobacteraceae bacterium]
MNEKELIASRAAALLQPGWVVNLGIGIPTLVTRFVDRNAFCFQTENGLLGVGPPPPADRVDPNLVDAGKRPVTEQPGAAFFDSATSFAMIRGGHVDAVILGALQVDECGRIANWAIPGEPVLGVGGAMDLMSGARNIIVVMTHTAKDGTPKLVRECTLPLTSLRPVTWVVTELATFAVDGNGLILRSCAPGVSKETILARTAARCRDGEGLDQT